MDAISRTLEITVISAENLRLGRKSVKKNAFTVIRIDALDNLRSTNADFRGGSNPSWNQKFEMGMPMHARFVTLEVKCGSGGSVDRVIGTARVPVSDFIGDYAPEGYLRFLSYRLRDARGERNGIVNVSVRVKGGSVVAADVAARGRTSWPRKTTAAAAAMGVPVAAGRKSYCYGGGCNEGVVTGVPVWCASRA